MPRTTGQVAATSALPRTAPQHDDARNNTGLYAVIGFLALIALIIGGIVLFNALSSSGTPSTFAMPNVVGQPLDTGSKTLTDAGLQVNLKPDTNPAVSKGAITKTTPIAAVTVRKDQVVDVYYNPIDTPFKLDDVTGLTQQVATDKLVGLGLTVDSTPLTENNPDVVAGNVVRTEPAAGQQVKQGDTIKLVVSAGPNQVPVPPVSGLSSANAKTLLESDAYKFVVTITNEDNATVLKGNSVRTDPAQGKLVDKGSAITLYVSNGPAQVVVPPLGNLTEAQARAKLTQLGLVPDVSYASVPDGDPTNGRVIAQSPSETAQVSPGSTVRVKVARALPPPTTSTTTTTIPATTTTHPATTTTHT